MNQLHTIKQTARSIQAHMTSLTPNLSTLRTLVQVLLEQLNEAGPDQATVRYGQIYYNLVYKSAGHTATIATMLHDPRAVLVMLCRNIADRQALDWPARTEMYEVLAWRVPDAKSDYEYLGTMAAPVFINQHRHLKTLREDLSYV